MEYTTYSSLLSSHQSTLVSGKNLTQMTAIPYLHSDPPTYSPTTDKSSSALKRICLYHIQNKGHTAALILFL